MYKIPKTLLVKWQLQRKKFLCEVVALDEAYIVRKNLQLVSFWFCESAMSGSQHDAFGYDRTATCVPYVASIFV